MMTFRCHLVAAVLSSAVAGMASAQSIESDLPSGSEPHTEKPGFFVLPDHGLKRLLDAMRVTDEQDRFSAKFGLVVMPADYTTFDQDAASREQVGNQQDTFEARSLRLMARGHFMLFRKWNYVASYEYKGFANEPGDPDWSATDLRVSTDIGHLGTLTVGKMKEPYSYEMVGDAANLPHTERLLSPFFVSRNEGVQLSNTMLGQRGTWAVGWFNDWLTKGDDFSDSGNDFAARVTALPVWSDDGARYLHVAASVRYYAGDNDTLRFRGQPASHVSDFFVDTGNIAGDHAWNTGLEALWNVDGFSLLGEYVTSSVSSRAAGDPDFDGYYVTAAYVLSGEHRPYDRKAGYARRVMPQGRRAAGAHGSSWPATAAWTSTTSRYAAESWMAGGWASTGGRRAAGRRASPTATSTSIATASKATPGLGFRASSGSFDDVLHEWGLT